MSLGRTVKLINGRAIPLVGLGTWRSSPGEVAHAVEVALKAGYRHIDAASVYQNENEVGQGIKAAGINREELFVTSKLWNGYHSPEKVEIQCRQTLKDLGLEYLDLYLMHWPVAFKYEDGHKEDGKVAIDWPLTLDPTPTWKAMEALVDAGLVRAIGVSNFTKGRIEALAKNARIKIAANQVELNLFCAQPELVKYCQDNDIVIESYSPLGSAGASHREDAVVIEIAKAHGVDPANILISWQAARGIVVLPKSVTPSRIVANFKDVILTPGELKQLNDRAASLPQTRSVDPSKAWGVDVYHEIGAKQARM